MRILLDSADLGDIDWSIELGLIDGVTANPASLANGAGGDHVAHLETIAQRLRGPVLAPVVAVDAEGMYREGKELAKRSDNIVVSIAMVEEGLRAASRLASDGVRVNMTLVFNAAQALLAAKVGAASVSASLGALDDISEDASTAIGDIRTVFDNYDCECELLAIDIRHPRHFIDAARIGVDGVAVPASVLRALLVHPLTDRGIDQFLSEWTRHRSKFRGSH